MMPKRIRLCALLTGLMLFLTGCTGTNLPITDSVPSVTLPPAAVNYAAPIGDAALDYVDAVRLYLPSRDGISLTSETTDVTFSLVRPAAESIVRALLAYSANKETASLGGSVKLSLYGANPVEVSRDVATVNLSASALQLDREALYIVCQAISNTLTELPSIQHVNVLVVDKPVGVDIANTLPMGALSRNDERDLSTVYEQLLSRRVAVGSSSASAPFSAVVPLYFPLQKSDGLVCEARNISFENQQMPDMVISILRELGAGPVEKSVNAPQLPLLADLLTSAPTVSNDQSVGGTVITLAFSHNLDDMIEAYGISRSQCAASLCYSLTSFLPNVSGIVLSIGGEIIEPATLADKEDHSDSHVFLRSDFSNLIYDYCTLYFADEEAHQIIPSFRAIPYYQSTNPRILLCELAKGPQIGDSCPGLQPVMPADAITDTVILGFALSDHTLLTNFAPPFAKVGEGPLPATERLFAYALVNTLCMTDRVKNVCFFMGGSQFDGFSGEIYWRGLFHPIPDTNLNASET